MPNIFKNFFERFTKVEKYIGLDLGASYTTIYISSRDEIIEVPSLVTITRDKAGRRITAYGDESKNQFGRYVAGDVVRFIDKDPLDNQDDAEEFLRRCLEDIIQANNIIVRPTVIMSIPMECQDQSYFITLLRRSVEKAFKTYNVGMIYEPFAAALGAGHDVMGNKAVLVVDIGGRTAQGAAIACGGIIKRSYGYKNYAGNELDKAIVKYIMEKDRIEIGENSAEQLKIELGCIYDGAGFGNRKATVRGKSMRERRKYVETTVRPRDIKEAILSQPHDLVARLEELIMWIISGEDLKGKKKLKPTVLNEISENAILTGGTSQLRGLTDLLHRDLNINFQVSEDPQYSGIKGIIEVIHDPRKYRKLFL